MIGEVAFVGSAGITKQAGGEVTWSGTIMKAKLSDDTSAERLEGGTQVTIKAINGNTLIVGV
jgi:membrane protein implicated in regulation of membrane protease activity